MLKNDSLHYLNDKIPGKEITVVIQGLLYRNQEEDRVAQAIASIRQHLPEAEIIISTWPHQSVVGLKADKVIISNEPVCFADENGEVNNILRQLVSTQRGIEAATRSYVLKFRADLVMTNANLTTLRKYSSTVPSHKRFFYHPVTVTNLFIRDPVRVPMLFHLSDLVQFGCKQDMLDLWSIRMPERNDLYSARAPKWRIWGRFSGYTSMRQVPEQTLMLGWLVKHGISIHLPHRCYSNYSLFKLSEQLLIDHFLILNWENSGITFPQRFHYIFYVKDANYTERSLAQVRQRLSHRWYFFRYLRLLINKYLTCWFNRVYLLSVVSNLLFSLAPSMARRIRAFYHARIKKKKMGKLTKN